MIKINNLEFTINKKEQVDALNNGELSVIYDGVDETWKPYVEFTEEYLNKLEEFRYLPDELIKYEEQNKDKIKYFRPIIEVSCRNGTIRYMSAILKEIELIDNPRINPELKKPYPINDPNWKDTAIVKNREERVIKLNLELGNPSIVSLKEKNKDSKVIFELHNQFKYGIPALPKYVYKFIENKSL